MLDTDESIARLIRLRNTVMWHNKQIDEHERCGRGIEAKRHRRIIGEPLDQIDLIECEKTEARCVG